MRKVLLTESQYKYIIGEEHESVVNNIYRYGSESWIDEIKNKKSDNKIPFNESWIRNSDIGEYGEFEGKMVPLEVPFEYDNLNEAEYKGKKVELNKPKRGGSKKFYVYVKNDKGNVIKVSFGDPNLKVRNNDEAAAKSFRARHNCHTKKDKTTPGYWSCNIHRYAKSLGLSSKNKW